MHADPGLSHTQLIWLHPSLVGPIRQCTLNLPCMHEQDAGAPGSCVCGRTCSHAHPKGPCVLAGLHVVGSFSALAQHPVCLLPKLRLCDFPAAKKASSLGNASVAR
jgi:hypothetical protein